jgi:hypothetical protein
VGSCEPFHDVARDVEWAVGADEFRSPGTRRGDLCIGRQLGQRFGDGGSSIAGGPERPADAEAA